MNSADVDPTLCAAEPLLERLDDGFSPPAPQDAFRPDDGFAPPPASHHRPAHVALGPKSLF